MSSDSSPHVTNDPAAGRFELRTATRTAHLRYVRTGDRLDLVHTEVPEEYEGRGFGTALVEAALDYARTEQLRIVPTCPFVKHYVDTHPETKALVA